MGHGPDRLVKTRGRPDGHGGRRSNSSSSTPRLIGSGPGRPVRTNGPPHGSGGAAHIEPISHGPRPGSAHKKFERMGRGPARPIKFSEDGPRPGPAHQNFRGWAVPDPARPSLFQKSRPGPARPIFKRPGPARPGPSQFSDGPGPAQTNGP